MSKFFTKKTILVLVSMLLISCGDPLANLPGGSRETPDSGKERALKNLKEGKGITLGKALGDRKTTYEFSSSNPMWRATFDVIDFMPLVTVDYSGGMIITDWYTDANTTDESLKFTIRFLSNEVQSNSIKIIVHNKKCKINENCTINEIDSKIKFELQKSILAKAALIEQNSKTSKKK